MNSLFSFVNYILACLVFFFLSVKILGDAKLERAYSSAACSLVLERNGTPNVLLCRSSLPPHTHENRFEFEQVITVTLDEHSEMQVTRLKYEKLKHVKHFFSSST